MNKKQEQQILNAFSEETCGEMTVLLKDRN